MSASAEDSRQKSGLDSFSSTFWIANVMELFERGAYYGLNALLARYLTDSVAKGGLGFREDKVGLLQGVVYAVTYTVPILGGALADRYGYRRMLLLAFSLLSAGYFVAGEVTGYWPIFAGLLVMAVGSGLFKPIISGTIARTTTEKNSGLGFGVYYWMINLGALVAPLVAGYLRGFSWRLVFVASSLYCAAMLIPSIFVYRDPLPKPENSKNPRDVLGDALTVLSDARFMLLIFVYSLFWVLYFQNFGSVLWYLRDFIDVTPINEFFARTLHIDNFEFDAEHVTVINAGTIVLLQIVVSRLVKNLKPVPTMIGGILIGSMGFLFLALSQNPWIFVLGIATFSVGEMTCHPKYYSYVGIVAPSDKKAIYMGYAFLYGVVGALVGSNIGGEMYYEFLLPLKGAANVSESLKTFWLVFAVLGVATMFALLAYNHFFGADNEKTRRRAQIVMTLVYSILVIGASTLVVFVYQKNGEVPVKTWIQGGIMVTVGLGGLVALIRGKTPDES